MNQSSAQTSDLNKRSKELDAREAYIQAREVIAEDTEKAIAKGQHELSLLDSTIVARELILKQQQERLSQQDKLYISNELKLKNATEREQLKLDKVTEKLEVARQELESIKASIQERTDYQKQQEELIAKQAEDGNLQLRGLEYEIIEVKQVIKDLETKKNNLYQECKQQESDIEAARASFLPEIEKHEAAVLVIVKKGEVVEQEVLLAQKELMRLDKEVNALLIKRQQIHDDVDEKLKLLDAKEREIMAKREALRQEREEMEEAKHYFQSSKSLYDTI